MQPAQLLFISTQIPLRMRSVFLPFANCAKDRTPTAFICTREIRKTGAPGKCLFSMRTNLVRLSEGQFPPID
jgi:hypothetical protein